MGIMWRIDPQNLSKTGGAAEEMGFIISKSTLWAKGMGVATDAAEREEKPRMWSNLILSRHPPTPQVAMGILGAIYTPSLRGGLQSDVAISFVVALRN